MAAGLWAAAPAALAAGGTPAAPQAALQLCSRALAAEQQQQGTLPAGEAQQLRQLQGQLEAASAAAASAGAPARAEGGSSQQQARYSREELQRLAAAAGSGTPPGLPPELALAVAAEAAAAVAPPGAPEGSDGSAGAASMAELGERDSAAHAAGPPPPPVTRYTREELLALTGSADGAAPAGLSLPEGLGV